MLETQLTAADCEGLVYSTGGDVPTACALALENHWVMQDGSVVYRVPMELRLAGPPGLTEAELEAKLRAWCKENVG